MSNEIKILDLPPLYRVYSKEYCKTPTSDAFFEYEIDTIPVSMMEYLEDYFYGKKGFKY